MKTTTKCLIFSALISCALVYVVGAKADDSQLKITDGFLRYKFGSMSAKIYPDQNVVKAGSKLNIRLEIQNANNYPIVDGLVYLKIYKKRVAGQGEDVNYFLNPPSDDSLNQGDFLVDQFPAVENINLPAYGNKKVGMEYLIPKNYLSGEYKIVSYFVSARKYNLLGLSFLDDVIGDTATFSVDNASVKDGVSWSKGSVKMNGEAYEFIGYAPTFEENESVKIEAPLINGTDKPQTATISWDLYWWDGMLESNKIKAEKETVLLNPNETKVITHTIAGNSFPVNFLIAKADWQDAQSILTFRISRNTQERARNNFMGLTKFPLVSGQSTTVFATAHAVKQSPIAFLDQDKDTLKDSDYQLILTLKDKNQKNIASWKYDGPIGGAVTGYESDFTPDASYDYAVLEAIIKDKNGNVIDQSSLTYDCKLLDQNACSEDSSDSFLTNTIKKTVSSPASLGVIVTAIGLLIILFYLIKKKRANISIFILLILSMSFVAGVESVSAGTRFGATTADVPEEMQPEEPAASTPREGSNEAPIAPKVGGAEDPVPYAKSRTLRGWLSDRAYEWKIRSSNSYPSNTWTTVNTVNAWVRYTGQSSVAQDVTNLSVGDIFYVEDRTHHDGDSIFWNDTGYNIDSPTGCWAADPAGVKTSSACYKYIYKKSGKCLSLKGMVSFKPPVISIDANGPVTCTPSGYARWKCTVNDAGAIRVNLLWAPTDGQFRYISRDGCEDGGTINGEFQSKMNCKECLGGDPLQFTCAKKLTRDYGTCSNVVSLNDAYAANGEVCSTCAAADDNSLDLPRMAIAWSYNATSPNQPPSEPVCVPDGSGRCPEVLEVDQSGNYAFMSTDPEGEKVIYTVDWADGTPNSVSSSLNSGQVYAVSHKWSAVGSKNITVTATDASNNSADGPFMTRVVSVGSLLDVATTVSCPGSITRDMTCPSGTCHKSFEKGATVRLKATDTSSTFDEWTGDCTGSSTSCTMSNIQADKAVTANFNCPCVPRSCDPNAYCEGDVCNTGCPADAPITVPGAKKCSGWQEVKP